MTTNDEASRLRDLQVDVRDQDDLERDITRQVGLNTHFAFNFGLTVCPFLG